MRDVTSKIGPVVVLVVVVFLLFVGIVIGRQFCYFMVLVDQGEVGVQFRNGSISEVVGPGVYSDFGLYVRLEKVSSHAIHFSVEDAELITKDKQRIGIVVNGDIFRPDQTQREVLRTLWPKYGSIFTNDQLTQDTVKGLALQAMKVCVGERTFDDNIIGDARDALRTCIDDKLSEYAGGYGLTISNVVVPQVILSDAVQQTLDAIVQSRLETEKAAQDALKAKAQAEAEQAKQEGEIRVAQSRIQEETRQQTILAQLEREKLAAQQAVIQAQKDNDLLAAEQDLAINKALAAAAAEKAKADLAPQLAQADMYARYPGYLQLQLAQANASALRNTDKIIFTPEGTMPTIVMSGPGIQPTVNVPQ